MFSSILFGISLVGLIALFALKSLELSRNTRTPLSYVRRLGDSLIQDVSARCRITCQTFSLKALRACVGWTENFLREARSSFDAALHACAARLNRYLRGRRIERRTNGEPSARLKTVLQKTDDTTPPASPLF